MTQKAQLLVLVILAVASCGLLLPTHASAAIAGLPITGTFTDSNGGVEKLPVRVVKLTDAEAIEAQCVELSIVRKRFVC
jgi:hypothetical protein